MFKLLRNLLTRRKDKPEGGAEASTSTGDLSSAPSPKRALTPEWERQLTASIMQNSVVPSEDVILYCYGLYKDEILAPSLDRQHHLSGLQVELHAIVAKLQALAPGPIRRAMDINRFEFSHILDHKETYE